MYLTFILPNNSLDSTFIPIRNIISNTNWYDNFTKPIILIIIDLTDT